MRSGPGSLHPLPVSTGKETTDTQRTAHTPRSPQTGSFCRDHGGNWTDGRLGSCSIEHSVCAFGKLYTICVVCYFMQWHCYIFGFALNDSWHCKTHLLGVIDMI